MSLLSNEVWYQLIFIEVACRNERLKRHEADQRIK